MNARSNRSYFAVYDNENVIEHDQILTNEEVMNYINNHPDYAVSGETLHLGLKSAEYSIIDNLLGALSDSHKVDNVFKINPVYLKDLYKW